MLKLWLTLRPILYVLLIGIIVFQVGVAAIFAQETTPEPVSTVEIIETDDGTTVVVPTPETPKVFGLSESVFMVIVIALGLFIYGSVTGWQNNKTWRSAFESGLNRSTEQLTRSAEFFDFSERLFKVVPAKHRHIFNDTLDWFDDAVERSEHDYPKNLLEFLKNLSDNDPNTRELPPI